MQAVVAFLFAWLALTRVAHADVPAASPQPVPTSIEASASTELEAWLSRLVSADVAARTAAVRAIDSTTPSMLPAIGKRLSELKRSANRDAMGTLLSRVRKGAGGTTEDERPGNSGGKSIDWFEGVMAAANPQDPAFRDLASILGLSRMLVHIATTPAVRELAGIYVGFGELLRADVERQMKVLGERAVATLIELRRGEVKSLRPWASKLLDSLGKTVPGEAVQTADNQVLADVLRAYGRTKDMDAARVIVSFANSDRAQVRDAAREAVMLLAENGLWQLRESYENLVGKKPPDDWGWEKMAGELFAAYDRSRLSEVYVLMDEGLAAHKGGKLDAMASAFDRVLARAPTFDRRREMVPGYFDFARSLRHADRPRAIATLRKAVRIDPTGPRARQAESELAYLEALELASRGVVDETAYRRAVELDPNNEEAKEALKSIEAASDTRSSSVFRYVLASILGVAALIAAGLALRWRRQLLA